MASPETIGTCQCENCGSVAYVKRNKGGLPYYRCGNCDKESREHSQRGARIFLQKVKLYEAEAPAPAPAKPEETQPAKPAPKAAPQTKAAAGSVASFLGL